MNWLKKVRKSLRYSQAGIAKEIGVSAQTVKNWEQGRAYPSLSNRLGLASVLGESVLSGFHQYELLLLRNLVKQGVDLDG